MFTKCMLLLSVFNVAVIATIVADCTGDWGFGGVVIGLQAIIAAAILFGPEMKEGDMRPERGD